MSAQIFSWSCVHCQFVANLMIFVLEIITAGTICLAALPFSRYSVHGSSVPEPRIASGWLERSRKVPVNKRKNHGIVCKWSGSPRVPIFRFHPCIGLPCQASGIQTSGLILGIESRAQTTQLHAHWIYCSCSASQPISAGFIDRNAGKQENIATSVSRRAGRAE